MLSQTSIRSTKEGKFLNIRVQKRPQSENQTRKIVPSIVHLSSFIQSAKKQQINKELLDFTQRKLSYEQQRQPFISTGALKKQKQSTALANYYKLEREASEKLKKRRIYEHQIFLSELTDQQPSPSPKKDAQIVSEQKHLLRSRRRNYVMRKLQFKNFLKVQEISQTAPMMPINQPKQIQYENQKLKQELLNFNIRNYSSDNAKRRKNRLILNQQGKDRLQVKI